MRDFLHFHVQELQPHWSQVFQPTKCSGTSTHQHPCFQNHLHREKVPVAQPDAVLQYGIHDNLLSIFSLIIRSISLLQFGKQEEERWIIFFKLGNRSEELSLDSDEKFDCVWVLCFLEWIGLDDEGNCRNQLLF